MRETNIRRAAYEILENWPDGLEFSSHRLRAAVITKVYLSTGQAVEPFHDTVLRYLRERRDLNIRCISRQKSLYKKFPVGKKCTELHF